MWLSTNGVNVTKSAEIIILCYFNQGCTWLSLSAVSIFQITMLFQYTLINKQRRVTCIRHFICKYNGTLLLIPLHSIILTTSVTTKCCNNMHICGFSTKRYLIQYTVVPILRKPCYFHEDTEPNLFSKYINNWETLPGAHKRCKTHVPLAFISSWRYITFYSSLHSTLDRSNVSNEFL